MKKSEINAKEFAKDVDKATNLLKKIEEAEDIFKLDLNSIKKEIDKCEIRCQNCHFYKTSKEFNLWEEINKDIDK